MRRIVTGRIFVVVSALTLMTTASWGFRPRQGGITTVSDIVPDARPVTPPPKTESVRSATIPSFQMPKTNTQLGAKFIAYLNSHPQLLGLTQTPDLRVDYLQTIRGAAGV